MNDNPHLQPLNTALSVCSVFGFYDDLEVYNPDEGSTTGAKDHADENDVRCCHLSGSLPSSTNVYDILQAYPFLRTDPMLLC